MLREIHIENYAVIDRLSVEFAPGLNLLSGETGSGKSILVDAVALALGARASAEVLRAGSDKAVITAVLDAPSQRALARCQKEHGFEMPAEDEIILRREIQSSGKSRLTLNDRPVTLGAVKALASCLVEIHGQGEYAALSDRQAQLEWLDRFAEAEEQVEKVGELYTRRRALATQMETLTQNEQERLRTLDLLSFQLRELEQARLEPGEDARLEEEKRVLSHLEKIRASAAAAYAALYEDDHSAVAQLAVAARALEELRRYNAALDPHLTALQEAKGRSEEVAYFLRDTLRDLDASPHRLEEVEDRLALLDRLKRKYGNTVDEVLAYRERARSQYAELENAASRAAELQPQLEAADAEYRRAAEQLSACRRAAADRLAASLREELTQLGMDKARFEVQFENSTPAGQPFAGGPGGWDAVRFMFSSNPGEDLRPLEAIASGGELSRCMLALRTVIGGARRRAGKSKVSLAPTFIFDEVDAGIGGRVAEQVGRRLKRLAAEAQVLCVTHLAQIACFADRHFYVEKLVRGGRTLARLTLLATPQQRAAELARMLSGSQITPEALRHAAAMLERANPAAR